MDALDVLLERWAMAYGGSIVTKGVKTSSFRERVDFAGYRTLPITPELMDIDRIMTYIKQRDMRMKRKSNNLYRVAWLYYGEGHPASTIGRLEKCSTQTIYNRLYELKGIVKRCMEGGIPVVGGV